MISNLFLPWWINLPPLCRLWLGYRGYCVVERNVKNLEREQSINDKNYVLLKGAA